MIIEETGYTPTGHYYMVVVLENLGIRNGYVSVKPASNLWGIGYSVPITIDDEKTTLEFVCEVHGGVTYTGNLGYNVIGADNHHFIGFDCGHCDDAKISVEELSQIINDKMRSLSYYEKQQIISRYNLMNSVMPAFGNEVYRSLDYVRAECYDLSEQLYDIETKSVKIILEEENDERITLGLAGRN